MGKAKRRKAAGIDPAATTRWPPASLRPGVEFDPVIKQALEWLAVSTDKPQAFFERLDEAQHRYREVTKAPSELGQDPEFACLGEDVVASYFAQAKSLIDDRRSYDFQLISRVAPWVKQLGTNLAALERVGGARERAERMLRTTTVEPDSAMLELAMASNYAAIGFEVTFVREQPGGAKAPEPSFLQTLRHQVAARANRFSPEAESATLRQLVDDLVRRSFLG